MSLFFSDMVNGYPQTRYKYYSYGYETYNVFINLVDTVLMIGIIAGGCLALTKYLIAKSIPG